MSPASGATIVLTRERRGQRDLLRGYQVIVDDKLAGKVRRGQTLDVPVEAGHHEVFLKIDWCRSQTIEFDAQPGDIIRLSCEPGGGAMQSLGDAVAGSASYIRLTRL